MLDRRYILVDRVAKSVSSDQWLEAAEEDVVALEAARAAGQTVHPNGKTWAKVADDFVNGYWISTVFLGINHRYRGTGPPLLFESMAFAAREAGVPTDWGGVWQDRCSTWEEAEHMHARAVATFRAGNVG